MKERLKKFLSQRQKLRNLNASLKPSAVLLPVFYKEGEYHIIFTKRTEQVRVHKGQISFPGGSYEEEDGTLLNTALRECTEEIGLAAKDIEVLGELDDMPTIASDYVVSPFVASVPWPYNFKLDPWEVAEIIEVPITALLDEASMSQETLSRRGQPVISYSYHYQGEVIWGASARILHKFLGFWEAMKRMGD